MNYKLVMSTIINNRNGYSSNLYFNDDIIDFKLFPKYLDDVRLYTHNNVRIQGNSNFIIDFEKECIIDDFSYHINSKYQNIDGLLYRQKANVALLKYNNSYNRKLDSGLILSGNFCQNYYHQMYEIMIKLLIIDKLEIPLEVPLIVDEIVNEISSFRCILTKLNTYNRRIEYIGLKEVIEFDRLFYISQINIIPPNIKSLNSAISQDIVFDLSLVHKMRDKLLELKTNKTFPKKIFISRKCSTNRKYNEDEVISYLIKNGFEVVYPEKYDLGDQISLFNGADIIVGASGAAFTNILFCEKDCEIICFQSNRLNIAAFTTIAYSLGVKMKYCLCESKDSNLHSAFTVNIDVLNKMLNTR